MKCPGEGSFGRGLDTLLNILTWSLSVVVIVVGGSGICSSVSDGVQVDVDDWPPGVEKAAEILRERGEKGRIGL